MKKELEQHKRLECKGDFQILRLQNKKTTITLLCSSTEDELVSREMVLKFDGCNIFENVRCMSFADMF
jgi:hypothetical protein